MVPRRRSWLPGLTTLLALTLLVPWPARAAVQLTEYVDPNPAPGNQFGTHVVPLLTGNVVITAPGDDAGGPEAGAVYLFSGETGALISALRGAGSYDQVGSHGVTALADGDFVVASPS
jgi:hypothetical protein